MEKRDARQKKEEPPAPVDEGDDSEKEHPDARPSKNDVSPMTKELQGWLNANDQTNYYKAKNYTSQKLSKNPQNLFYGVITAYCNLKMGKTQECLDLLMEFKG